MGMCPAGVEEEWEGGSEHRTRTAARGRHRNPAVHTCITQRLPWAPRQQHFPAPLSEVSQKNSEERTDTGNVPGGNKAGDQIKICAPSLLKQKWRSEIQ